MTVTTAYKDKHYRQTPPHNDLYGSSEVQVFNSYIYIILSINRWIRSIPWLILLHGCCIERRTYPSPCSPNADPSCYDAFSRSFAKFHRSHPCFFNIYKCIKGLFMGVQDVPLMPLIRLWTSFFFLHTGSVHHCNIFIAILTLQFLHTVQTQGRQKAYFPATLAVWKDISGPAIYPRRQPVMAYVLEKNP